MKRMILAILAVFVLTGGIGQAADLAGIVTPGEQFTMTWTPPTEGSTPEGYLIERSIGGATWVPMTSIIANEYVDTLQDGQSAQYRVRAYLVKGWTDLDGYHEEKLPGPYSDVSDVVLAEGTPQPLPGKCGQPTMR